MLHAQFVALLNLIAQSELHRIHVDRDCAFICKTLNGRAQCDVANSTHATGRHQVRVHAVDSEISMVGLAPQVDAEESDIILEAIAPVVDDVVELRKRQVPVLGDAHPAAGVLKMATLDSHHAFRVVEFNLHGSPAFAG